MKRTKLRSWFVFLTVAVVTTSLFGLSHSFKLNEADTRVIDYQYELDLSANPNPFDDYTFITVATAEDISGSLIIKNQQGEIVKELYQGGFKAGNNVFVWDGTDDMGSSLSPDRYLCELTVGRFTSRTIILILK
jgi:hypothetical protein